MSSAISLEYLNSIETYKGEYETLLDLETEYPTANLADYAYVTADLAFYYWNSKIATPSWVNQNITVANYSLLTASEKSAVPYIIIP